MTNPIFNHLAEAGAIIISTWDIVITPYLTLGLHAQQAPEDQQEREPEERPLIVVQTWDGSTYALGGIGQLKTILTPDREHLIHSNVFGTASDHWDWPVTLLQATDGILVRDAYGPQDVWEMVTKIEGSDWSIAERLRCTLRQVKRARKVRDILLSADSALHEDWSDALQAAVDRDPEMAGADLAEAYNQL